MRMRILILLFLCNVSFCSHLFADDNDKKGETMLLHLEVKINKQRFKVGDKFIVILKLKNISEKNIYLLPAWFPMETRYLEIKSPRNKSIKESIKKNILMRRPEEKDLELLKPNRSYKYKIKGKIVEDKLESTKRETLQGLFLEFYASAFYLAEYGNYSLKAHWNISDVAEYIYWGEVQEKENLWEGHLVSEPVEFELVE